MRSRPFRGERGSVLVLTAVTLAVLLGITALSVDASFMFDARHRLAAAADAAARAGAFEVRRNAGISHDDLANFASYEAMKNGLTPGTDGITIEVNHPPLATYGSTHAGDTHYVEVVLRRTVGTFFMKVFSRMSMTPMAWAVAGYDAGAVSNFIILDPTDNNTFTITGGSSVDVGGSIVIASTNSAAGVVGGGGSLTADGEVFVASGPPGLSATGGSVINSPVNTNATMPVPLDPFASRARPSCDASKNFPNGNECASKNGDYRLTTQCSGGTATIYPGVYASGIRIQGCNITFAAGLYTITGTTDSQWDGGAQVNGTGVTIFNNGTGKWTVSGNTTNVTLTAPTSGTALCDCEGMLYWQDNAAHTLNQITTVGGGGTVKLTGIIYMPTAEYSFTGGSDHTPTDYTIVVAWKFNLGGGGVYSNSDVSSLSNGSPTSPNGGVSVVE